MIPLRAHTPGQGSAERQRHQQPPDPPQRRQDEPITLYAQRLLLYMMATRNPYPMQDEQLELVTYAAVQATAAKYDDPRVYEHIGSAKRLALDLLAARQRDQAPTATVPTPAPRRTDTIGPLAPVPIHPAPSSPAPGDKIAINF